MDLKRLSPGERYMSLAGVLLVLDLLVLPWHRISIGIGPFGVTASRSGIESPNGFLGLLALLLSVAIVARIVVGEFTSVELPALPVTWQQADLIAGAAVAALVVLKLLVETSYLSIGAWLALPLAAGMAYGGYVRSREATTEPTVGDSPAGDPATFHQ
jgi:hypothetical protein